MMQFSCAALVGAAAAGTLFAGIAPTAAAAPPKPANWCSAGYSGVSEIKLNGTTRFVFQKAYATEARPLIKEVKGFSGPLRKTRVAAMRDGSKPLSPVFVAVKWQTPAVFTINVAETGKTRQHEASWYAKKCGVRNDPNT